MITFGGLNVEKLGIEFISMGFDGSNVFQGARIGVTTQMKKNVVSFLMRVHNFGH